MELENTTSDIITVFGAGSPETTDKNKAADFEGISIHCALNDPLCSPANNVQPDLLRAEALAWAGAQPKAVCSTERLRALPAFLGALCVERPRLAALAEPQSAPSKPPSTQRNRKAPLPNLNRAAFETFGVRQLAPALFSIAVQRTPQAHVLRASEQPQPLFDIDRNRQRMGCVSKHESDGRALI
ncbi:MAG TPA: hypothetical protein VEG64_04190 [Candidatus Sulfotelmatobacter sp.]|nr:hypothetical protein [Candidatus Sulfotelmatobacter sp.]